MLTVMQYLQAHKVTDFSELSDELREMPLTNITKDLHLLMEAGLVVKKGEKYHWIDVAAGTAEAFCLDQHHYIDKPIQPIQMIEALGSEAFVGFCLGNIIKYYVRRKEEKDKAKMATYVAFLHHHLAGRSIVECLPPTRQADVPGAPSAKVPDAPALEQEKQPVQLELSS